MRFASSSPPEFRNIEVDDVAALDLDQAAEAIARVEVFAGADRDVDGLRHARHHFGIARRHRILQPHRLDGRDHLGHVDRVAHVVFPVRFDPEVDVGPELFAHDLHGAADAAEIFQREAARVAIVSGLLVVGIGARRDAVTLEFEGGPAELLGLGLAHLFAPRLRIFRLVDRRHRPIEADAIAEAAAEQVAGGRVEQAPGEIPQRDLDAARGGHGDAGDRARAGALHQHLRIELVDVERVFADDDGLEFVEDEVFHAPSPVGFADAVRRRRRSRS